MAKQATKNNDSAANLGFEAKLWLAADKLRNNMDAAEYNHVVLGLIFLKYISDAFEEMRAKLLEGKGDYEGADPEDADEYKAENVFWVPKEARWPQLQAAGWDHSPRMASPNSELSPMAGFILLGAKVNVKNRSTPIPDKRKIEQLRNRV